MAAGRLHPSSSLRGPRAGLSLLETATVISLSGVLLSVFVPTFIKHVRFSKVAEATEQLDALYRGAAAYYATEHAVGQSLLHGCLPESAGPFPAEPSMDPVAIDYTESNIPGSDTWHALGQNGTVPLRYSYSVIVAQPGCAPRSSVAYPAVVFRAVGDLDGDGVRSTLERGAAISPDQATLAPMVPLRIQQRVE